MSNVVLLTALHHSAPACFVPGKILQAERILTAALEIHFMGTCEIWTHKDMKPAPVMNIHTGSVLAGIMMRTSARLNCLSIKRERFYSKLGWIKKWSSQTTFRHAKNCDHSHIAHLLDKVSVMGNMGSWLNQLFSAFPIKKAPPYGGRPYELNAIDPAPLKS